MRAYLAAELRRHPWIAPGLALTASAALGAHLTELVALLGRLL